MRECICSTVGQDTFLSLSSIFSDTIFALCSFFNLPPLPYLLPFSLSYSLFFNCASSYHLCLPKLILSLSLSTSLFSQSPIYFLSLVSLSPLYCISLVSLSPLCFLSVVSSTLTLCLSLSLQILSCSLSYSSPTLCPMSSHSLIIHSDFLIRSGWCGSQWPHRL